jgi:hypothetical protein
VKDKAEQNAKPAVEFNDRTYFLLIDDANATREARQWVMQQYPDSEARVVAELRLHRLTARHTVIPIFKNGSIEQGSPVKVSDHWDQANEENPVVVSSFVPAVAKSVLPCTVNYRSDSGTLRVRLSS